ncbi:MAG: hypothetical protein ACREAB_10620 [Blastocatellia bacterium]
MIENDDQLNQTRLAIADLESAMAALKRDVLPLSEERFAVMAEPIIDHIRELRRQVEEYVGITAAIQVWQMRGASPAEVRFPR